MNKRMKKKKLKRGNCSTREGVKSMLAKIIDLDEKLADKDFSNECEWDAISHIIKTKAEAQGLSKIDLKRICEEAKGEVRNGRCARY